jgi:uncharacterized protein (DUF433 family)
MFSASGDNHPGARRATPPESGGELFSSFVASKRAAMEKLDWSDCPLVEVMPGVQSGAPVLRGTRMPVDAIVDNFDYGASAAEIAVQFEIPPERVEAILTYAQNHRFAHPV